MALSLVDISIWTIWKNVQRSRKLQSKTMTETILKPETRRAGVTRHAMVHLVEACNHNDRFKLLEDEDVPPGDLDNSIHPIFHIFDWQNNQKQAFKLASLFLTSDSVLVFFVRLLYGIVYVDPITGNKCLSDPLEDTFDEKRQAYLSGVRDALHCLTHCVSFQRMPAKLKIYARTMLDTNKDTHAPSCTPTFKSSVRVKIQISPRLLDYYTDPDGYATATRCAQFRHDLLFATTLVHEIVHAVGVLRRGDTDEPYLDPQNPCTEWGFAWEHFMFGTIINPERKRTKGTHILMRKLWVHADEVEKAGGKQYCDVSMAYIGQWFRKDTWDIIARKGPATIPPPVVHFKIQPCSNDPVWLVSYTDMDLRKNLCALYRRWEKLAEKSGVGIHDIKVLWQAHERLQRFNVTAPVRRIEQTKHCPPLISSKACGQELGSPYASTPSQRVAVCRSISPDAKCSRKRKAEEDIDSGRSKIIRLTSVTGSSSISSTSLS